MSAKPLFKPEDCADPVCHDKLEMFKRMMAMAPGGRSKETVPEGTSSTTAGGKAQATPDAADSTGCPLSKDELGNATWALVHTAAAYYPEKPTAVHRLFASVFFMGLAYMYPCSYCAKDFQGEIRKEPPSVESRESLSLWACRQHNIVNEKLGKPLFRCDLTQLDERWKTGKPSCWEPQPESGPGHSPAGPAAAKPAHEGT